MVLRHGSGGSGAGSGGQLEVTEEKRFSSSASVDVNWRVKGDTVPRGNVRRSVAKATSGVVTVGGEFSGLTAGC